MQLSDFDYFLPEELIATTPLRERSSSRLLVLNQELADLNFTSLPQQLNPGDLLIRNNTKVVKARLFGHKPSGARVEVMLERILDSQYITAHIRTSKAIKEGMEILLADNLHLTVVARLDGLFRLKSSHSIDFYAYFARNGQLPLPPYMKRQADFSDEERYQTVYALHDGSVAAPTAGLHFNQELLENLQRGGVSIAEVTLHVGSGTFKPVSVENIALHKMHSESYTIPESTLDLIRQTKARGKQVICVGTTSLRALETAARNDFTRLSGDTDIFITPGFEFKVADRLITNFHLPKSTLLMLVSAFSGKQQIDQAYRHAINLGYRFFSYGDAMLLSKKSGN